MIEVEGRELSTELEVVTALRCPGRDALEHGGPVSGQVHRFRNGAEWPEELTVFVPHATGPEREVENHVCTGLDQVRQASAQLAFDLCAYIFWQGHRGDAARPCLLVKGQAGHPMPLVPPRDRGLARPGWTAHEDDTSHERHCRHTNPPLPADGMPRTPFCAPTYTATSVLDLAPNGGSGSAMARVFGTLRDKLAVRAPVLTGRVRPDQMTGGQAALPAVSLTERRVAGPQPGRGSAGGGAGHQFGGGHGDGGDHRDRRPPADAPGQRVRAAHRGHVHGAQPGRGSRPRCPVPVPRAPGAGRGEQRAAQLTTAGPPRGKEPPGQAGGGDRRGERPRSATHGPDATRRRAPAGPLPQPGVRVRQPAAGCDTATPPTPPPKTSYAAIRS